jgi:hypothetical protein
MLQISFIPLLYLLKRIMVKENSSKKRDRDDEHVAEDHLEHEDSISTLVDTPPASSSTRKKKR